MIQMIFFDILLLDQIGQQSRTTGGTHKEIQLQLQWCCPGDTSPALRRVNIWTEHQHRENSPWIRIYPLGVQYSNSPSQWQRTKIRWGSTNLKFNPFVKGIAIKYLLVYKTHMRLFIHLGDVFLGLCWVSCSHKELLLLPISEYC